MEAPTTETLVTVAGLTVATVLTLAVLLPALNLSTEVANRFGPLLAVGIAEVWTILATLALGIFTAPDIINVVMVGLVAGLAAIGTHQTVKKTVLAQPST